jgi:sodium transport system permease protein
MSGSGPGQNVQRSKSQNTHSGSERTSARSFLHNAPVLMKKELRETLRDRRTIVTLLAMPVLLYPLLGMLFRFVAIGQSKSQDAPGYIISVPTDGEALWLNSALEAGEAILRENWPDRITALEASPNPEQTPAQAVASMVRMMKPDGDAPDAGTLVASMEADLVIRVELDPIEGQSRVRGGKLIVTACSDSATSQEALRYVEDRIQATNLFSLFKQARFQDPAVQLPVRTEYELVASNRKSKGFLGLMPLVLLLMTVTGGVYPAIDLTAGERERDTLETLVALPIPRVHLLFAKYIAVLTVTLLTGFVNSIAMSATVFVLQMETQLFGEAGLTPGFMFSLALVLVVFALFYSAVLLAITSSSRSFKEAQAYLIPLMLMSISPGLVVLLPGWHLEGVLAVVPLVNMLLLAGDLFTGTASFLPATAAVVSTLLYAAGALALAARLFGNDAVATGSRGTWSDLFQRPVNPQTRITPGLAATGMAALFPLYFFFMGLLNRTSASQPAPRLILGAAVTLLLFVVLPAGLCLWQNVRIRTAWRIHQVSASYWIAVVLLGLGTWPLIYELVLATRSLGLVNLSDSRLQQVAEILERWKHVPLPLMIITLGVITGISEEIFFRGFLLNGLREMFRPNVSAIACGILFGLFHVIAADGATLERFLPSASLGIILSWVAVRTGSLLPGMVMHVLHNSSLLALAAYQGQLSQLMVANADQEHLPALWLTGSAGIVLGSLFWIWRTSAVSSSSINELTPIPVVTESPK